MTILQKYIDKVTRIYVQTHRGVDPMKVKMMVGDFVSKQFKDIPCKMNNNMTHESVGTTINEVSDWIETKQPIITGNGTFFRQQSEYKSPEIVFTESLLKERKSVKRKMFGFPKGSPEYINLNTQQLNIKVIVNASYGGSGTPFSPFYSLYLPPATTGTAKNITTTLICCLEFLFGNTDKWIKLKDVNELFDMMFAVLDDEQNRELIHDTYTVDEVLKYLMNRVLLITPDDIIMVKTFLMTLSNDQLTKLMLAFNIKLVLKKYVFGDIGILANYMLNHQLDLNKEITVESLMVSGFGATCPEELKEVFPRIKKVLTDNCCYHFIPNDAETRAAEISARKIVCVTDTDSLMVHFSHCIDEFQVTTNDFRASCLMATAIGLRLFADDDGIISKEVEIIADGYNIKDKYYSKKFVFKNEFGFLAMALFAKKMYASSCFVQEGNPRDIHSIAVSGMSFKKRDAAPFLEPIMTGMYDTDILTTSHIRVETILDKYYELRRRLQDTLETDVSLYKVFGLKEVGAYDKSKTLNEAMRGALIWNVMNPEEEMQPMDRVTVIKLSWKKLMDNESNPRVAQLLKYNKLLYADQSALAKGSELREGPLIDDEKMSKDPVICIPESYKEIPEYIRICIDKEGMVDSLLTPFKQLLGLFDVYMADTNNGVIASRMVCL